MYLASHLHRCDQYAGEERNITRYGIQSLGASLRAVPSYPAYTSAKERFLLLAPSVSQPPANDQRVFRELEHESSSGVGERPRKRFSPAGG